MHKSIFGMMAAAGLLLMLANSAQAATVNEHYVADLRFGNQGKVTDMLVDFDSPLLRASGQRLALDVDGSTVVVGFSIGPTTYNNLVVVRYGADGERLRFSNPTPGYGTEDIGSTGDYLYVSQDAPDYRFFTQIQDVKIGSYGDINILVDAKQTQTSDATDSLVVTFGPDGAYKGIVTHKTGESGTALLPWGSSMFIVSSSESGVNMARYNMYGGVPALDTSWGSSGFSGQMIMGCKRLIGDILVNMPCPLRASRAVLAELSPTRIYVAGHVGDFTSSTDDSLFVMSFAAGNGASAAGFPATFGVNNSVADRAQGLAVRNKSLPPARPQHELYLLDAFQRPCGHGFIVARFNAETGAYIDRTYTRGGGADSDPNVCHTKESIDATDMTLAQSYTHASRYLAVVGNHYRDDWYASLNAFVGLVDTENMLSTVQIETFTNLGGPDAPYVQMQSIQANVGDGTYYATGDGSYTATGTMVFDDQSSMALTLRVLPDRIFRHGFESN